MLYAKNNFVTYLWDSLRIKHMHLQQGFKKTKAIDSLCTVFSYKKTQIEISIKDDNEKSKYKRFLLARLFSPSAAIAIYQSEKHFEVLKLESDHTFIINNLI